MNHRSNALKVSASFEMVGELITRVTKKDMY